MFLSATVHQFILSPMLIRYADDTVIVWQPVSARPSVTLIKSSERAYLQLSTSHSRDLISDFGKHTSKPEGTNIRAAELVHG